ncbi:MAG: hypothetical protein R3291_05320, partial [Thermoplasmata archaeon]|nr:hypothetical protein [Thermoplasmata archaeon]
MKTPSAAGLLRLALALVVVVAVVGLATSLPRASEGGVGLPDLRSFPSLEIDPFWLVVAFGIGSSVLFFLALLLYRPRSARGSVRGVLVLVFAVSALIVLSYLVQPSFPEEATDFGRPGGPPEGATAPGGGGSDGPGTGGTDPGATDGADAGTGPGTGG